MSTKLSIERHRRSARWREVACGGLLGLGLTLVACAPISRPSAPRFPEAPAVRVGIAVDTSTVAIGATSDYVVNDAVTRQTIHRLSSDQRVEIRAAPTAGVILRVGTSEDTVPNAVDLIPSRGQFVLIDETPYRGTARVQPTPRGTVTAVNVVGIEDYLLGVVPYEIGRVDSDLFEAASAQAVAARTYAIRYLGRREPLGFDVFATVEDQVYGGALGEHEPVSAAVRRTAGQILTYGGQPIEAFYHSTCAGRTAAIDEVWPEEPRPYLRSVIDVDPVSGIAYDASSSRFRWSQSWSAEELRAILSTTLADSLPPSVTNVGELVDFQTLALTPSGRIRTLRITTSAGTFDVGGDRIRWIFLTPAGNILNSSKFDVRVERDDRGAIHEIVAEGMGWGHGIGMCQVGAMGRARAGQDYRRILETYYIGSRLSRVY